MDTSTLEVEVLREQGVNSVFSQLSAQGVQVLSMRNKANRLEELFVTLVHEEKRRKRMMQLFWVALKSIWYKEIQRFMRIWVQTLVPPVITMTLYFIIFGNLIGSRIGEMHGFTYMQFIVPGLIMMAVITNAYANVASSFFSAKFQRNIEELLVAPVPTHVIIAGYVGGGVARGLCVGVLVTAVSLFFRAVSGAFVAVRRSDAVADRRAVFSRRFIERGFAKTFDDISLIPTFVLTPLTYLGGVFYSLTLLPPFWQALSHLNPIVYMISGFRLVSLALPMYRCLPRSGCWWCLSSPFICSAGI